MVWTITVGELLNFMISDQTFAVLKVTDDGEYPLYAGDGTDEEYTEEIASYEVCNFQAYCGLVFIIV